MTDKIKEALRSLDPANDSDWTDDGMPLLEAVATLAELPELTRQEITKIAPGFTRTHREFDVAPEPTAAQPSASGDPVFTVESIDKRIEAMRAEASAVRKTRDDADREWNRLTKEIDKLINERERVTPKQNQADAIKAVVAAEHAARESAATAAKSIATQVQSPLDAALGIRRPAQRPNFAGAAT